MILLAKVLLYILVVVVYEKHHNRARKTKPGWTPAEVTNADNSLDSWYSITNPINQRCAARPITCATLLSLLKVLGKSSLSLIGHTLANMVEWGLLIGRPLVWFGVGTDQTVARRHILTPSFSPSPLVSCASPLNQVNPRPPLFTNSLASLILQSRKDNLNGTCDIFIVNCLLLQIHEELVLITKKT